MILAVAMRHRKQMALRISSNISPSRFCPIFVALAVIFWVKRLGQGTNKRARSNIEMEPEERGAHLNAYTSREQTFYYSKVRSLSLFLFCFSHHLHRPGFIICKGRSVHTTQQLLMFRSCVATASLGWRSLPTCCRIRSWRRAPLRQSAA